jgi:hypothetical protein
VAKCSQCRGDLWGPFASDKLCGACSRDAKRSGAKTEQWMDARAGDIVERESEHNRTLRLFGYDPEFIREYLQDTE